MSNVKGALQSKAVWGAIFVLIGAFGLLPFGIVYDAATNSLVINLDTLQTQLGAVAVGGGGVLSLIGRLVAKSRVKGVFGS